MRAHPSEPFVPSVAWEAARGFLLLHARSAEGGDLAAESLELLMLGVWTGCRLALLERGLALGVAAAGNEHDGPMYRRLRRGFAIEFGDAVQQRVRDLLFEHGFRDAPDEPGETSPPADLATATAAVTAAQVSLRGLGGRGRGFGGGR